jgi:hypothetical protein
LNFKKFSIQPVTFCVFIIMLSTVMYPLKVDVANPRSFISTPNTLTVSSETQYTTPDNSSSFPHPSLLTFTIPAFNSQIGIYSNVNYKTAKFENNTWFFTGLKSNSQGYIAISGNLYISAKNCSVIIGKLQEAPAFVYSEVQYQWLGYSVNGSGTQTLYVNALFSDSARWIEWTVRINGETKQIGDSWNYSYISKELTITTSEENSNVEIGVDDIPDYSSSAPLPTAEPALRFFTSGDRFQIPSRNGTFNFATDGSYDKSNLDEDSYNFINLTLNNYVINAGKFASNVTGRDVLPYIVQAHYPANLGISVENCSIIITGISPLTWHSMPELNYTVQGTGSQVFKFPFPLAAFNWTVYINGVSKANNDGWSLETNNQLKITNATSNVAIIGEELPVLDKPTELYNSLMGQLALAIGTTVLALATIILLIKHRRHRKLVKKLPDLNIESLQLFKELKTYLIRCFLC